jgi:ankyrin repeat protein
MPINFALQRNDEATIELLMARTSRITRTDSGGRNLLHWAVNGRVRPPVIQQLIDKGCDYDRMDTNGETPLTLATRTNQTKTVAVLHAAGARVPLRYLVRRALTTEKPFKPGFLDYE